MEQQKRKHERTTLSRTVRVHDVVHQRQLGELVNITIEGMMIVGQHPLQPNAILQIALELPAPIGGESELEVGVTCLWCRPADGSALFWAGFQIIDASMASIKRIENLIREYRTD